jgi:hypothetical protein
MDNDVEDKRRIIMKAYDSDSWETKVKAMSDSQVIAIYLRFKRERKI